MILDPPSLRPQESKHALVLAGGGSVGAVQAGMLMELCAAGVRPDLIVGVSAVALNGAFLAYEFTPRMLERMAGLWSCVRTRDILPLSWGSLLGLIGRRGHISDGRGIRDCESFQSQARSL